MKEAVRMRTEEKRKGWAAPVRGALVSLGVYLGGAAFLAWLMASGAVKDCGAPLAVLALTASLVGGLAAPGRPGGSRRSGGLGGVPDGGAPVWAGVPNALLSCVLFAAALGLAGLACWRTVSWSGEGGVLLGCVLAGGLAASLLRGGGRKKRRMR